ncbi:MAG: hypothetical protein ACAI25_08255 [Planctomycetota bacterium]
MRSALVALRKAKVPYAVVDAVALGVRGLPRFTHDLDVVVGLSNAFAAIDALEGAGYESITPVDREEDAEPMYVLQLRRGRTLVGEVDVLVAVGEPESTVILEAGPTRVLGVTAPVASLEHLLLMYLYSNQPKHIGDFARIVNESGVNLKRVEGWLREEHREMLSTFRRRVKDVQQPPEAPPRPRPKRPSR